MDSYNRQKKISILISKKNIAKNRVQRFYDFSGQTVFFIRFWFTKAYFVRFENSWGLDLGKMEKFSNPAELQYMLLICL